MSQMIQQQLEQYIPHIATQYPRRHVWNIEQLYACADWIAERLTEMGYAVERQTFNAIFWSGSEKTPRSAEVSNLVVRQKGRDGDEFFVLGAHYDSRVGMLGQRARQPFFDWDTLPPDDPRQEFRDTPGANDNASGVAALLCLAEALKEQPCRAGFELVFWVNEEYPFFSNYWKDKTQRANGMGSYAHAAKLAKENRPPRGTIALDCLGWYGDGRGQCHEGLNLVARLLMAAFMPQRNDIPFLLSGGPWKSRQHAKKFAALLQAQQQESAQRHFPVRFTGWSDDWSYWQFGIPAFCITDGAYLRARHYHRVSDRPEKIDFPRYASVTENIIASVIALLQADA